MRAAAGALLLASIAPTAWTPATSPGVTTSLVATAGGVRILYDFHGGSGWTGAARAVDWTLPEDWTLSFRARGGGPANTLEIKLADEGGENVWWARREGFTPKGGWTTLRVRRRELAFAWGPAGGGVLRRAARLEIVLAAGSGGSGELEIADVVLAAREGAGPPREPAVSRTAGGVRVDLGGPVEFSGLAVDWGTGLVPPRWEVSASPDGRTWATLARVGRGGARRAILHTPDAEARFLRLSLPPGAFGTPRVDVKPPEWAPTANAFVLAVGKEWPRGELPRAFSGEQSYWTVVGVDGDGGPSLLGEDGALEPWPGSFSVEPFLLLDGTLHGWSDVGASQSLDDGHLPIPSVAWRTPRATLAVTAVASGRAGASTLLTRYRVTNASRTRVNGRLLLAIRPFQVNPPAQFLGTKGGVAPLTRLRWDGRALSANGDRMLLPFPGPSAAGTHAWGEGSLVPRLARGDVPSRAAVEDESGLASAVLSWNLDLPPGAVRDVVLAAPLHAASPRPRLSPGTFEAARRDARRAWKERLDALGISVPPAGKEILDTLKANVAYMLVTRQGPALRPGARSYARSWIRDGALMSAALLRVGESAAAKDFLAWYAGFQFPDGRVPCCVDARGADPVAEHDSHGEFLFLAAEILRLTGDVPYVRALWPRLARAAAAIESLAAAETAPEFRGLLPASISHEGYSARPVHSFWDDFWAWKGLSDAAEIASALGLPADAARLTAERDRFAGDVTAALEGTVARHGLAFVPGSVELHDFDPTATTVAVDPCDLADRLPAGLLAATFDAYLAKVRARAAGGVEDAYTPYEIRSVGTFLRLSRRADAWELLRLFLKDRRPVGFRQWPEIVRRDPRTPGFLGDLPHAWVGSDFVRAALDVFAFRRADGALVLGSGIPGDWLESGPVRVDGLATPWGRLAFSMERQGAGLRVAITGPAAPPGGFVVAWPFAGSPARASVNGRSVPVVDGAVPVHESPADVVVLP